MLLDRYRQLLTAYVDGELSSRQRRRVVRLLRRWPEARQLLLQLKADARAVRRLPLPPLPLDFTGPVLRTITERGLKPRQRRAFKAASAPEWMGPLISWAAAAAVLLILGAASYLYFVSSLDHAAKTEIAKKRTESHPEELGLPLHEADEGQIESPETPATKRDQALTVDPPNLVKRDRGEPSPSIPDKQPLPKNENALTGPLEQFPLERVPDLVLTTVKVSDLDRPPERKQLLDVLGKDTAFRLELPCQNGWKAFERVQNAARALNIGLVIDKQAQERINRKWRINYAFYLENITPEELTQFVRQIGAEDRRIAAGKALEAQIDWLVLTGMSAGHRKELATLLGVDPTTEPGASGRLKPDPLQPLADVTARQVEQALAGQGGAPRPDGDKPAAKPPERLALVLAYNPPVRSAAVSDEIKHFLENRKPARHGTIRVFLVLRG